MNIGKIFLRNEPCGLLCWASGWSGIPRVAAEKVDKILSFPKPLVVWSICVGGELDWG